MRYHDPAAQHRAFVKGARNKHCNTKNTMLYKGINYFSWLNIYAWLSCAVTQPPVSYKEVRTLNSKRGALHP